MRKAEINLLLLRDFKPFPYGPLTFPCYIPSSGDDAANRGESYEQARNRKAQGHGPRYAMVYLCHAGFNGRNVFLLEVIMQSIVPFIALCGFMLLGLYSLGFRVIDLEGVPNDNRPAHAFLVGEWVPRE